MKFYFKKILSNYWISEIKLINPIGVRGYSDYVITDVIIKPCPHMWIGKPLSLSVQDISDEHQIIGVVFKYNLFGVEK